MRIVTFSVTIFTKCILLHFPANSYEAESNSVMCSQRYNRFKFCAHWSD